MQVSQEECDEKLERWLSRFKDAGIRLAALAVVRRGEASVREARDHLGVFTVGMMEVDERHLAEVLQSLAEKGYVERHDDKYRITSSGKRHMYMLLKQWNRYVDAMNNLWGCYYGT